MIKYRGQSSAGFPKKSFAIRTLDAPLEDGGRKTDVSLLEMKSGKKWALLAEWVDRSYIRQTLAYELARPLMDYVPKTKYCELIVNGTYYGLYQLSEQPTRKRLNMKKDGVLIYFTHAWQSNLFWRNVVNGDTITSYYEIKSPNDASQDSMMIASINADMKRMVDSFSDTKRHLYEEIIDIDSFIDYQLSTEFSKNLDAYNTSAYIYRKEYDSLMKMALWDVDISFGGGESSSLPNGWVYDERIGNQVWWSELMKDEQYRYKVVSRWKKCRQKEYSNERIENVIDSLTTLIKSSGAVERDSQAWKTYSSVKEPNPYVWWEATSFDDEIRFLKDWVELRLMWMDEQLCD